MVYFDDDHMPFNDMGYDPEDYRYDPDWLNYYDSDMSNPYVDFTDEEIAEINGYGEISDEEYNNLFID